MEDLQLLLALNVSEPILSRMVRERGLAFPLDAANAQAILRLGTKPEFIGVLALAETEWVKQTHADAAVQPGSPGPVAVEAGTVAVNPKDDLKYVVIPNGEFKMGCSAGDFDCSDDEKPTHTVTITKSFWLGRTEVPVSGYERFAMKLARSMPSGILQIPNRPIVNVTWNDADAYCRWSQVYYRNSPSSDPPGASFPSPNPLVERVVRGGSYSNNANALRLSARDKRRPERSFPNLGFRCVWYK
jgi:formylglycine-generating enzyme required for sulfatase activity